MSEEQYISELLTLLRRMCLKSRQFCNTVCFPDGLLSKLKIVITTQTLPNGLEDINEFSYDYDYYAFTKSVKTLHAIWTLYKDTTYYFNEDILSLVRCIFENHILSRYLRDNIDTFPNPLSLYNQFINNPLGISLAQYTIKKEHNKIIIVDKEGNNLGFPISGPARFINGDENNYYRSFYGFLCSFTHCDFGNVSCYMENANYNFAKNNYRVEALLFAIFSFTKIFEGVVTVEGEDFSSFAEEKEYYDLAYDSLELQKRVFDYLISKYTNPQTINVLSCLYSNSSEPYQSHYKFRDMLIEMKVSLDDCIGSLEKAISIENINTYIRTYPNHKE